MWAKVCVIFGMVSISLQKKKKVPLISFTVPSKLPVVLENVKLQSR